MQEPGEGGRIMMGQHQVVAPAKGNLVPCLIIPPFGLAVKGPVSAMSGSAKVNALVTGLTGSLTEPSKSAIIANIEYRISNIGDALR
jgi:hypothetical protein